MGCVKEVKPEAIPGTTFHRLSVQDLYRAASSRVDLVINHVLQALIVSWADEYLCRQLAAGVSIVEHLQQAKTSTQHVCGHPPTSMVMVGGVA